MSFKLSGDAKKYLNQEGINTYENLMKEIESSLDFFVSTLNIDISSYNLEFCRVGDFGRIYYKYKDIYVNPQEIALSFCGKKCNEMQERYLLNMVSFILSHELIHLYVWECLNKQFPELTEEEKFLELTSQNEFLADKYGKYLYQLDVYDAYENAEGILKSMESFFNNYNTRRTSIVEAVHTDALLTIEEQLKELLNIK